MKKILAMTMVAGVAASAYAGDCPGDCNGDGAASILDFVCFQGLFQAGDDAADCNGDGTLSILDFVCFQQAWQDFANGGCDGDPCDGSGMDENMDDYDLGNACGQGCWESWDQNPDVCLTVSDEQAFSGSQSMQIDGTQGIAGDDGIYQFDISEGTYTFECQTYCPSGQFGNAYILLLNQYAHGGTKNWSTQVRFDVGLGVVESEFEGAIAVIQTDAWVPFRVEIDLGNDIQEIYYDDELISTKSWKDGVSNNGLGTTTIQALDLYGNEPGVGAVMYVDDISLISN